MVTAINISSILFAVVGTYLLSRQHLIKIIINHFVQYQLKYEHYEDIPFFFRFIARFYGINKENMINLGTYRGDNIIENKLRYPKAPFIGFLYISIGGAFQIIGQLFY